MKKKNFLGAIIALALVLSPAAGFSDSANTENIEVINAAKHHYYVLSCDTCHRKGVYFSRPTGALGKALMKSHIKSKHKKGTYTKKDVCTAMGCHTSSCNNNTTTNKSN